MIDYIFSKKKKLNDESNISLIDFLKNCLQKDSIPTLKDETVKKYFSLIIDSLHEKANNNLQFESSSALLSFLSNDFKKFSPFISEHFLKLKSFIYTGDEYSREKISKLLASLYFYVDETTQKELMNELKENVKNKSESMMHGAILTFGNISALYFKKFNKMIEGYDEKYIISLLDHHKTLVQYSSCHTIGEIGKYGKFSDSTDIIDHLIKKLHSKDIESKVLNNDCNSFSFKKR
jgi:hypothetical protein